MAALSYRACIALILDKFNDKSKEISCTYIWMERYNIVNKGSHVLTQLCVWHTV